MLMEEVVPTPTIGVSSSSLRPPSHGVGEENERTITNLKSIEPITHSSNKTATTTIVASTAQ